MFPDKPGGISLYAHEGWRSRFNLFGPIGAFGYWIGWSVVLSFVGNIVGALIVAEWFPSQATKVYFNLGFADFGLAQLIAVLRDPRASGCSTSSASSRRSPWATSPARS